MDKVIASTGEAVTDIRDGSSIAVGGFGLCGIPNELLLALLALGAKDLEVVDSNIALCGQVHKLVLRSGLVSTIWECC